MNEHTSISMKEKKVLIFSNDILCAQNVKDNLIRYIGNSFTWFYTRAADSFDDIRYQSPCTWSYFNQIHSVISVFFFVSFCFKAILRSHIVCMCVYGYIDPPVPPLYFAKFYHPFSNPETHNSLSS